MGLPALRREQWELLEAMVAAEQRRAARGEPHETFAVIYADQATIMQHPDLGSGGSIDVAEGDIRALLGTGLLEQGGSDTLLQVSGAGEAAYRRRRGEPDPVIQERDAQWSGSIDRFASAIGTIIGSAVALILVAVFGVATFLSIQQGSVPGAGASLVAVVVAVFSFADTAFGIGPFTFGRKLAVWIGAGVARWLLRRLDPAD